MALRTIGALLLGAFVTSAHADCMRYMVAILTGSQEVPQNASAGLGAAQIAINTTTNVMDYRIVYWGLGSAETAAHIHGIADVGVNAGILHTLPPGTLKVGTWTYPESLESDILAGRTYINIHSLNIPGGEIRGQIVTHVALLDGNQEVPPVPTAASGWAVATVNTAAKTLSYHIVHNVAGETAAHFHGNSNYQVSTGIKHTLPGGSPKSGVWSYPAADEVALLRGLIYINVHSALWPGGEVRGQLTPIVRVIDNMQEVPPNASNAKGFGLFAINEAANTLGYDIRHNVANETAAHIHGFSPPGINSGIQHTLAAPAARKLGVWGYPAASLGNILGGNTYVNVHSVAFPGGEIRGQIEFAPLPCPGDINGDGVVNQSDLGVLLSVFGSLRGQANFNVCADLNGDGAINQSDLGIMLSVFGQGC